MPDVAIVDYGRGNLFSVKRACEQVGLSAIVTAEAREIEQAASVVLPGVGAFGDAMDTLRRLDLVGVLQDAAASNRPFLGICLGIQLLMTESFEFGCHRGLDIIEGVVARFDSPRQGMRPLKVPQVGWNRIEPARSWQGTPLESLPAGAYMYFVHSFVVHPADGSVALSTTRYGQVEFCSSLARGNVFACQFHPERSGSLGLEVFRHLADSVRRPTGVA